MAFPVLGEVGQNLRVTIRAYLESVNVHVHMSVNMLVHVNVCMACTTPRFKISVSTGRFVSVIYPDAGLWLWGFSTARLFS